MNKAKVLLSIRFLGHQVMAPNQMGVEGYLYEFLVTRSGDRGGPCSANWEAVPVGQAPITPQDFQGKTFPSGRIFFAAEETSKRIAIRLLGGQASTSGKTLAVELSGATDSIIQTGSATNEDLFNQQSPARIGAEPLGFQVAATQTILSITPASASKVEGSSGGLTSYTFTVTRSGDTTSSSSANWNVAGIGAIPATASDFQNGIFPSGTVAFAAGETTKTITVRVNADQAVESNETFAVILSRPVGAIIRSASATGNIVNDDRTSIAITPASASKAEGSSGGLTPYTFTVTRSGNTTGSSSAIWKVSGFGIIPATAADFQNGIFPSGTVVFAAGETTKIITVNVNADVTVESNETFAVTLTNAIGAVITTASATGTIFNDDRTSLAITPASASKAEGSSGGLTPYTFTVTRSGITTSPSSALWTVAGIGPVPATAADFQGGILPSGTVAFAVGETTKTITINVNADQTGEFNETFAVTLSSPLGAVITTPSAAGTIVNDDTSLAITPTSASKAEGSSGGLTAYTFTVTRSGLTNSTSSASWKVTGIGSTPATASDFKDGVLPSGTVTFAPGQTSQAITVHVNADLTVEADETFAVTLFSPVGATISTASATGTIRSDDFGLSNRGERLIQTGRWLETLDPQIQSAILSYQSPKRLAATDNDAVLRWVIAGASNDKENSLPEFIRVNGLAAKQDLSVVFNLPGISFLALEPGAAEDFAALKQQADAAGISLWYELKPDYQEDAPVDQSAIGEPAFTGNIVVNGANASLIHLFASDLSNPVSPRYGINAVGAWQRVGGEGVVISVNDSPFDLFHTDLINQILDDDIDLDGDGTGDFGEGSSPNGVPDIFDGEVVTLPGGDPNWRVNGGGPSQEHGTAVAGIIAAQINGSKVVGVAPQSQWIPDVGFDTDFNLATRNLAQIINNSWGSSGIRGMVIPSPTELQNWRNAWEVSAAHPAISQLVNSAGNGRNFSGLIQWQNTNTRGFNRFRQVISVAAAQRNGDIEVYSTPGSAVLVAAPVNSNQGFNTLTSDVSDDIGNSNDNRGYRNGDLAERFNGTSAAAPMVSGVIALMLEANPALTRRDIQHILVRTAQKNRLQDSNSDGALDSVIAGGTTELRTSFTPTRDTDGDGNADPYNTGWFSNGAGHWVSDSFGFGIVDAGAAVDLARTWVSVRPELTLASDPILTGTPVSVPNGTLGSLNSLSSLGSWTVNSNLKVEWAEIELDLDISNITELMLVLVSPAGTRSVLLNPGGTGSSLSFTGSRTLVSNQFWDETALGTWSLEAIDTRNNTSVQKIGNAKLNLYGTCSGPTPLTIESYEELAASSSLEEAKKKLANEFLVIGGAAEADYEIASSRIIGAASAWGTFENGVASNLNVDNGLIFTSGKARNALGPNDREDTTTAHGLGGYWITDQLVSDDTFDASALEVVFKPTRDINLQWNFQFASEEFAEWAGSQFNDAAGVFIAEVTEKNVSDVNAGRPISGLINLTQQASLDDGSIVGTGGPTVNALDRGKLPLFTNSECGSLGWEYDGGTGPRLHSRIAQLRAGKTYVLTAIAADTADQLYDSGLIIGQSKIPHILLRSTTSRVLEDGATSLQFLFERTGSLDDSLTINYAVSGTASLGSDYAGIPLFGSVKTISFAAGSASAVLTVDPITDNTVEVDETVAITLAAGNGYVVSTPAAVTGTIENDDTVLNISPASLSKAEGNLGGLTAYTFTVTRSGLTTGTSSAAWAVTGAGLAPASGSDFFGGALPTGTLSFAAGQTSKSITINVQHDLLPELNEGFNVALSGAVGATIAKGTAEGVIANDDIVGNSAVNTLNGTLLSEYINGRGQADALTGGLGFDIFGFNFGESTIAAPDRISDFAFGVDKIKTFSSGGSPLSVPALFARAADNSSATNVATLAAAVYADANGGIAGNQPLAANQAAFVVSTNAAIAGKYVFVNDGFSVLSSSIDTAIKLTGTSGVLPPFGVSQSSSVFA